MIEFRPLKAEEVECRVSQCNENGLSLLLYKTARTDMDLLDETVGSERWQNRYETVDGKLFCELGIKCGDEWVWKSDTGTESNMEPEKGQASDAFKRAGFRWGIGRELYTAPFIWVPADMCSINTGRNGKPQCYDKFAVTELECQDGRIVKLQVANMSRKGAVVFGTRSQRQQQRQAKAEAPVRDDLRAAKQHLNDAIKGYCDRRGADYATVVDGMKSRPEWESQKDSADYIEAVAREFEE